jgi:hypothetical protein
MSIKSNNQTNRWHQAVYNLYPGIVSSIDEQGNPFDTNSNPVVIDEAAVGVETERLDAIKAANRYRVVRERTYPPIGDQLDMQYWDKINATSIWPDLITTIKEKYPKG